MNADFFAADKRRNFMARLPLKRLGEREELTASLLLLVSAAGTSTAQRCRWMEGTWRCRCNWKFCGEDGSYHGETQPA